MAEDVAQVEQMLPAGWVWARLDVVCSKVQDGTHFSPQVQYDDPAEGRYLYITAKNIKEYGVDLSNVTYVDQSFHDSIYRRCNPERDDVLLIKDGVKTGVATVNQLEEEFSLLSSVALLKPTRTALNPYYLKHYLNSPAGFQMITGQMTGTAIKRIILRRARTSQIPLAPLQEQLRIVAEIEKHLPRLDAGVAALERAQANLKRYRASVLKAACEGRLVPTEAELARAEGRTYEPADQLLARILAERRAKWDAEHPRKKYKEPASPDAKDLPELPEGWAYSLIESLLSTSRSGMKTGPFGSLLKKHEHQPEGIPVLGIENIGPTGYIPGNKIFITEEKADQLSRYDVQPNDVLISRSGTVGEVCVVPEGLGNARFSTNLMRIVLTPNGMLPKFFRFLFNGSPFVLDQVSELCSGSTRDFLNQKILKSVVFPLPPLAEQRRIVAEVERRLSVVAALEREVEAALTRAARLRQSILKRAFEGRLVEQDPNDEPAAVLLERIRTERKAGKGKSSRKKQRRPEKPQQLEMF